TCAHQAERKRQRQHLEPEVLAPERVGRYAEYRQHQAEGHDRATGQRRYEQVAQLSAPNRLQVRAEHLDELLGLHERLLCLTRPEGALRPGCTETLVGDCDMPDRAAASRTLSPSSFTY